MAQIQRYFVGFSTQNTATTGISQLYDIDLINVDLMTAFQTRVGERVMRPDYGCKLWDMIFEPLTPTLRQQIITEAIRICSLDSRLVIDAVQVFELNQGFRIEFQLQYLPWLVIGNFTATFENNEQAYFQGS